MDGSRRRLPLRQLGYAITYQDSPPPLLRGRVAIKRVARPTVPLEQGQQRRSTVKDRRWTQDGRHLSWLRPWVDWFAGSLPTPGDSDTTVRLPLMSPVPEPLPLRHGAAASSGSLNPLSESNATIAAKRMESVPLAAIPPRLAKELRHRWDTDIGRAWRDWHGESGEIGVADTFPLLRSRVHALTLRDLLIPRRVKAAKPLVGVQLVVNDAPKAPSAALARNPGLATTPP